MTTSSPPPLPGSPTAAKKRRETIMTVIAINLSGIVALCLMALVVLRMFGLVRPFSVPTAAMSPAIEPGDHILVEGVTYLAAKPRRGDVVVFKTDGIPAIQEHTVYVKRLVGLPGDHLRLFDDTLYVNDQPVPFCNRMGAIRYVLLPNARYLAGNAETVRVPDQYFFVLGDNSARSLDSRFWGFLPAKSVLGRAVFCYWPPAHLRSIQ